MSSPLYNALPTLATLCNRNRVITPRNLIPGVFAFLNSMPTGIVTPDLMRATRTSKSVAEVLRGAFTRYRYATMLPYDDSGAPERDEPAYAFFTATEHLAPVAEGLNAVIVDLIDENLPPGQFTPEDEDIADLAMRQYAKAHRIDDTLPIPDIIEQACQPVEGRRPPHIQDVRFRALGSFAFARGVWGDVEHTLHDLIRDPAMAATYQPPVDL